MAIRYVLFDLDGTLLPMDQDVFVEHYFRGLAKKLAPHGYEPRALIDSVWRGTMAMIRNDGTLTNEETFWQVFSTIYGTQVRQSEPVFEKFYETEFQQVQSVCGFAPQASQLIQTLKARGLTPVLATNPIFPRIATLSRIRWAGLQAEDFALITTYENSRHSKPNPAYYRDILAFLGADPAECVMVGNDVGDDMVARELGMQVFLLTDCLINKAGVDISQYPHGGFTELTEYLMSL